MRLPASLALVMLTAACYPVTEKGHFESVPREQAMLSSNSLHKIAPGDVVRVTTRKGRVHTLKVISVEPDSFQGLASDRKTYRIPFALLAKMELRVDEVVWHEVRFPWLVPPGW